MMKKVTIKDIARESGVSVATVSYILNDKHEQKISEATRKKVLQIVNLLNYTPNQSARNLATNQSGNIAVHLGNPLSLLKRSESMFLFEAFAKTLEANRYHLLYLPEDEFQSVKSADAILCYDMPRAQFLTLGENNFIPLVAMDADISHPLFYQVNTDLSRLQQAAEACFCGQAYTPVFLDYGNAELKASFLSAFPNAAFLSDYKDVYSFIANTPEKSNLLLVHETLFRLFSSAGKEFSLLYERNLSTEKLQKALDCIQAAISRVESETHNYSV